MLDIDGTLAPIAATPDNAFVPLETVHLLSRLAKLPGVHVALVSGRAVTDALRMLDIEHAWVIGNHGLELRTPEGELTAVPEAREFERAIAQAADDLERLARETRGVLVENKRWTLSLHYRLADERMTPTLIAAVRDLARERGLVATEGKKVLELRPPGETNKGSAAQALAGRLGALTKGSVFYAGDDRTDEDAFRALRSSMPDAVTVKVLAQRDDAMPAATDAEFTLESTEELRRLLEWLHASRTRQPGAR